MRDRNQIVVLLLILVVGIGAGLLGRGALAPRPPFRPNVLLITIDTLRADRLGAYGWRAAATPVLDRLASGGMRFPNAFTAVPVTLASHATLLTGRNPHHHGVRGNSFYRLREGEPTLATSLKQMGYDTAAVVGAAVLDHRFGLNQGFDSYDDEMAGGNGGTLIAERDASAVVSRAVAWLNHPGRRSPFCLWVHLFDPHHPYEAPEPFRSRFPYAPYDGEIAFADEQIGRLLTELAATKRLEDTIVVATSDHGESFGEHGEATHGVLLYDSTLRVPLIISGPGVPRGERVSEEPVGLVDVTPTILALVGGALAYDGDGRDLLGADRDRPRSLYAETFLPLDFYNWSPLRALRGDGLKFIDAPEPELYDLTRDPSERQNLAETQTARAVGMAGALARIAWTSAAAAGTRPTVDAELAGRLRSLGYVAGAAAPPEEHAAGSRRPNPRNRLSLIPALDRALTLVRANRQEEATVELRSVLSQDPGNYLAARTLGDALFELGKNDAAIAAYRRALANGRDDGYYHYRIALLHERQRSYGEAAREFARLVDMDPEAAAEVADRADRLLAGGAAAAAIEYFRAAQRADHGAALAVRLADAQLGSGRAADAVETLERARESHPAEEPLRTALVRALNALGAARGDAGDLAGALRAFSRAASIAPSDFESLANGGLAQVRAGQMAAALETLTRALALRPGEVRLLNPVAELRFRRGELSAAHDLLSRSLAVDPRQPRMQAALREVQRRLAARGRLPIHTDNTKVPDGNR
jgi:choline-sulfatase